ncbi:group II intron maturase-specific domain-containing protein [Carnobacterium antarcticum]|uniref:Group II intron maturase-specific domain-containing protein n=2 Tax=Carnobacterium antarcticum TaxID=2126436 RepID=A0ABW4NJW6_9LACT
MENTGKVRSRPSKAAKLKFRNRLRKLTSRKRPGTFKQIIKEIDLYTQGWINYYGIGDMKSFIKSVAHWLNHRLRQLCWKRWNKVSTKFRMLRKYGIEKEEAWKVANTRKGYWRMTRTHTLHRAITKKKLVNWGLKDLNQLFQQRYLSY